MIMECPYKCVGGIIWNEHYCGDEDHCDPAFLCPIHGEDEDEDEDEDE